MNPLKRLKSRYLILLGVALIGSILLVTCTYEVTSQGQKSQATQTATPSSHLPPEMILGVGGGVDLNTSYPGIPWVRLSYPTCGLGNLSGQALKDTIQSFHNMNIHVMLTLCQVRGESLFDMTRLNDVAQAKADAVQCGNEQMKNSPATIYIPPDQFAKFYDLCEKAVHAVRPGIPVILGALDPQVVGDDLSPLLNRVHYLDAMQSAMNTSVHQGGTWDWHSQIVGLIDSWHNGYPSDGVNNLQKLFAFWAQQFHVDLNSGELGNHLWVIEGTGCFKQCGLDTNNSREIAVSHILTLITDVQTTLKYHVPFFYFSGRDFIIDTTTWPIGLLDVNGHPKPLRQDLPMGARTLQLSCSGGTTTVTDQENLLAKLYAGCTLPGNAESILKS